MKQVVNPPLSLYYEEAGEGAPLLLLHGFPLSGSIWREQIKSLSKQMRVIAPDLRGFGKSSPPDIPYSMDLYADDAIMLLDHLGIEKAGVCGMSMGGYVLLNMLERYPERVSRACFMVTKGGGDDTAGKGRRTALAREVLASGVQVAADTFSRVLFAPGTFAAKPDVVVAVHAIMMEASPAGAAGALIAMRKRPDYSRKLGRFGQPSLVIGAEEDMAIPSEESRKLADGLKNAELHIIPDAGHMVMLEQPETVNGLLSGFFLQGC